MRHAVADRLTDAQQGSLWRHGIWTFSPEAVCRDEPCYGNRCGEGIALDPQDSEALLKPTLLFLRALAMKQRFDVRQLLEPGEGALFSNLVCGLQETTPCGAR